MRFCRIGESLRATAMDAPPSRQTAGLSRRRSTQSLDQEVTSRPEGGETNPLSTEWTDEKHSLYLNSMEASFVSQLYDSPNFLDWPPRKRNPSKSQSSSRKQYYNACISSSDQFKVLRGGMWQKMKFVRAENHQRPEDLLSDQWIKHFKSSRRGEDAGLMPVPLEHNASTREAMRQKRGKQELGGGDSDTSSRQFGLRNPVYYEDYLVGSINIEVSDQNFMEDDNGPEEMQKG